MRARGAGLRRVALLTLALSVIGAPAATLLSESVAFAKVTQDDAIPAAQNELTKIEQELPQSITVKTKGVTIRSAAQLIADGELLFRLRDYPRAILLFSQVMEKYSGDKPAYAEAAYRAGEALYASRDYLSARTKFRIVVDNGKSSEFRPYFSRAIARLVDIAWRVDDPKDPKNTDEVLARIASLGPTEVDSTVQYAKGKALYFKKDFDAAKAALGAVGDDGGFKHQARFILGVIALKQAQSGKYQSTIDTFAKVTELPPDTEEHREVIDLAWIAIGRLFYEMDQLQNAVNAYSHIDKSSKHFETALYEVAWVHVRQEEMEKAIRALDLLSLTSPDGPYSIEGELLKADILLRKAEFRKALEVYERVRDQLDPMRKRLEDYLGSGKTPADYYDKLTGTNFEALDGPDALPPVIIKWAKEQEDGGLAFSVVESVQQTKELLSQAQDMLDKLQLVVKGRNKLKAYPELRDAYERQLALINRISVARAFIGQGLDDADKSAGSGELATVRARRRALQAHVLGLPTDPAGFAKREDEGMLAWKVVSQKLQAQQLSIDMLQAKVTALRKYLASDASKSVPPAQLEDWRKTLETEEAELKDMRKQAAELRKLVDMGKVQVGTGDDRFGDDEKIRNEYRDLLERELALVGNAYASKGTPVLARARTDEEKATGQIKGLDAELEKQLVSLRATLDAEQVALDAYREQLVKFDDEARLVVGEVAKRNFGLVKDKLTTLVMRAEVGIIDQAWNEREVRKMILRDRQVEMKDAERLLDDELRQITGDGAGFE